MNYLKKKYTIISILIFAVVFIVCFVFSERILTGVARALMYEDPLVEAQVIVVLTGSYTGNRIKAAAKLYHEGFGEKLVFSGFKVYPGAYSSNYMKAYALKLGVPEKSILTSIPEVEISTRGESMANLEYLNKHGIKKIILVTSGHHTRRAKLIYERMNSMLGYEIEFLVYPADDPLVPKHNWWKLRTGQKGIFLEYVKLIDFYLHLS